MKSFNEWTKEKQLSEDHYVNRPTDPVDDKTCKEIVQSELSPEELNGYRAMSKSNIIKAIVKEKSLNIKATINNRVFENSFEMTRFGSREAAKFIKELVERQKRALAGQAAERELGSYKDRYF